MSSNGTIFRTVFPRTELSKGERKKLEMVLKAIELFGEKGVEATSYDDLAKALGTSRSHISYHFQDRDELILGAIRYMMEEGHEYTFAKMREGVHAKERFLKYLDGYYDFFVERPQYGPLMLYFYCAAGNHPVYRDLQSQVREGAFARLSGLAEDLLSDLGKRRPRGFDQVIFSIQSQILGGLIYALSTEEARSKGILKIKANVAAGVERVLRVKLQ